MSGANGRGTAGTVLITGGAGFVGINLAARLLADGVPVVVFDNLSRPGVEANLHWLAGRHGGLLRHIDGDVRDAALLASSLRTASFVYHFAAQVAVTTSLADPLQDHAVNLQGTLNVLEGIRKAESGPGLLFASTNKVYGALEDIGLEATPLHYSPGDPELRQHGVNEDRRLDFISPYGCSKGAADQYVLDYCRSYGLRAVVLRMSCIYGPRQQASSDQGWVTHFLRSARDDETVTIFGDGRQVRDLLYIDDFVDALLAARRHLERLRGRAWNIGGGVAYSLSLQEAIGLAERLNGRRMQLRYDPPRPGDQKWFAADHRRFSAATGWQPRTAPDAGIDRLWSWLLGRRMPAASMQMSRSLP